MYTLDPGVPNITRILQQNIKQAKIVRLNLTKACLDIYVYIYQGKSENKGNCEHTSNKNWEALICDNTRARVMTMSQWRPVIHCQAIGSNELRHIDAAISDFWIEEQCTCGGKKRVKFEDIDRDI